MNMKCPICGSTLREGETVNVTWIEHHHRGVGTGHWFFEHFKNQDERDDDDASCMESDTDNNFHVVGVEGT